MSVLPELERVYRAIPSAFAQNVLVSARGWQIQRSRYRTPEYRAMARAVAERWSLSGSGLREYQAQRLRAHLRAAESSPFWRRRFQEYGVRPGAEDPFHELARLPVLTRPEVQEHAAGILNPTLPRRSLRRVHSSGTTGAGLVLWETPAAEFERWSVWWRYRRQFGVDHGVRCAVFGGFSIVPAGWKRPPFWRYNYPGRQLLLSAYHFGPGTARDYWRALSKWGAPWLQGYPSFMAIFAELCAAEGLPPLPGVRWITTAAENLLASQRARLERTFGVPVRQHYGLTEAVANISERLDGTLRVDEDFALVELVPVEGGSGECRIVGTNWSNPAFPLLRYDSGDRATPADRTGDWRAVRSIDGRREDYVVLPSGARVGRLDHIFKDLLEVREAQIYQASPDAVLFRVVKGAQYDARAERRLIDEARLRLGHEIDIRVEYVEEIPKGRTGKLRFVVSELAEGRLEGGAARPA